MSNNGPINMGGAPNAPASVNGREVNPDKDETTAPNIVVENVDDHMKDILKHVPRPLQERVSKLDREELSLPGIPRDREAYEAYLGAEKMIRDLRRRKEKKEINWKGLSRQNG